MITPEIPAEEKERLLALHSYNVLDTIPEDEYDDFTRMAAQICNVPIALISLVDENRQWFKSRHGLGAEETPREYAFCAHAINTPDELLEVHDATKDPRFQDNPLVTGEPHVIFYTGSPLITPEGQAIGTLCVIDNKPRAISEEAKETLKVLARQVVTRLELRKKNAALEKINERLHHEISIREEKEQELILARDKAQAAERMKENFLANISHEIYTPMNGIVGFTNLLLLDQDLSKEHKEYVEYISFSANHLSRLVDDMLDFKNMKTERLSFRAVDFDLLQLLRNMHHTLSIKAREKGIDFKINHDVLIPAELNGDPDRLGQILMNIADNGIKFTKQGSVCITTKLLFNTPEIIVLEFEVKDTGIGIPKDKLEQIFEQFSQSDNNLTREYEGTGLGLSIAKRLIEQFGGKIEVDSTEGVGSCFKFTMHLNQIGRSKPHPESNHGIGLNPLKQSRG